MKHRHLNISENFICRIWEGGNKYYKNLLTTNNEKIELIEYGKRNTDGGPDYTDARLRIGNKLFRGDIEIHRNFDNWLEHKHKGDHKYNSVVLQVVLWDDGLNKLPKVIRSRNIPTVVLSKFLNESIHNIWQEIIENPSSKFQLPCNELISSVDDEVIINFLQKLAIKRLQMKMNRMEERLAELSKINRSKLSNSKLWEQLLYEFIFEALGYSKNKEPMMKLAGIVTIESLRKRKFKSLIDVQSVLFGVSGLMFNLRVKDDYIQRLKELWKGYEMIMYPDKMNVGEWQFFRMRPQNFPTLRIAYGSQIIEKILNEGFLRKLIYIFKESLPDKQTSDELWKLMEPMTDEFWSTHYNFSRSSKKINLLLGKERFYEIVINVVIPFVNFYSKVFNDNRMKENILKYYLELKSSAKNSVTKMMTIQLLSKRKLNHFSSSFGQGLIHLHNFYCIRGRCDECEIGKKVFLDGGYNYRIIFY